MDRVKLLKVRAKEAFTRYGDQALYKVKGLTLDLIEYITNMNWVVRAKAHINHFNGGFAAAWTCVNNCAQDFQQFRSQSENYQQLEGVDKISNKADDFIVNIFYKVAHKSILFGIEMVGTKIIVGYLMGYIVA
ncbi:hypothetical protein CVPH_1219 [Abyssogena phaseoliformis symbiont OG214]|uniref:hypothetical protein n=1 Tax=Abyssogena phaseoliformis symbiont TaxID=596095 RepID=UPI0019168C75|nr:hypothetical protein [Abyssogena phaseoliformis symbiont]MBW5289619.1 hypothetical protein [Candidatus Ruthia sp. Apha_13_S6]BBB23120.1 hypothetical protein CVPH_1219 [Abyssogena phaseoliformis symbiont OG214]